MRFNLEDIEREISKSLKPFAIGDMFESGLKTFKELSKTATYPPYNIIKKDANKWILEMAVAGFSENEIEITLENDKLIIKGDYSSKKNEHEENYIFKSIASRNFQREFALADNVEIKEANLANGLLRIWLEFFKTKDETKKIPINKKTEEVFLQEEENKSS